MSRHLVQLTQYTSSARDEMQKLHDFCSDKHAICTMLNELADKENSFNCHIVLSANDRLFKSCK